MLNLFKINFIKVLLLIVVGFISIKQLQAYLILNDLLIKYLVLLIFGVYLVILWFILKAAWNNIWFFTITSLVFGLTLVFIIPLGAGPDERAHYQRSLSVAQGNLIGSLHDKIPDVANFEDYNNKAKTINLISQNSIKYKFNSQAFKGGGAIPAAAIYSPINYLPQALGMFIAKQIYRNRLFLAWSGRLFNLVSYVLIGVLILYLLPGNSTSFSLIMLLPMVIHQASSLSADAINFSLSFLFVSYITYLKGRLINFINILLLTVLAFFIGLCKPTLIVLFLAILLLNFSYYKSKVPLILSLAMFFIIGFSGYYLWIREIYQHGLAQEYFNLVYTSRHTFASPILALKHIISAPSNFIQLLLATVVESGVDWFKQIIGVFGQLSILLPKYCYYLMFIGFILSLSINKISWSLKEREIAFLLMSFFILTTIFALYSGWTPQNSNVLEGLQGRYLIPCLPLILIVFSNNALLKYEVSVKQAVQIIIVVNLFFMVLACIKYFYGS